MTYRIYINPKLYDRYGKYDKITNELLQYEEFYFEDKNCEHVYVVKMSNVDHIEIE